MTSSCKILQYYAVSVPPYTHTSSKLTPPTVTLYNLFKSQSHPSVSMTWMEQVTLLHEESRSLRLSVADLLIHTTSDSFTQQQIFTAHIIGKKQLHLSKRKSRHTSEYILPTSNQGKTDGLILSADIVHRRSVSIDI